MDAKLAITTIATVFLALLGYLVTYLNNLRLAQRTERLDRVNRQLAELYGPLFALTYASDASWRAFRSVYRPNQQFVFGEGKQPTETELATWRLWMTSVFMPMNLRMYEIVLSKSDLLIEMQMPESLLLLCAHVAAYQAVMKRWENHDYSEHVSLLNFPDEILKYAETSYQRLKSEQEKLLGNNNRLLGRD
jgi:hypothetical protein